MKKAISAHNGFTARIVSGFDFDFIWASSLEISASFAKPDASILSADKTIEVVKNMVESSSIPIIVDCDSGYGSVINTYYVLKELKKAGAKAVCIEDNIFPKQNSFYKGERKLEDPKIFSKKVEIAKSIFSDPDEFVIARTEALIQNLGEKEALKRAEIYSKAGADMILPHSKKTEADEIISFARSWNEQKILVAVPSKYPDIKARDLEKEGFKFVIYANHTIRAIKKSLEEIVPRIIKDDSSQNIEESISPIGEILEISGMATIKNIEKKYGNKN